MLSTHVEDFTPNKPLLAVSLELSKKCWKIAFQDGHHERPSIHNACNEDSNSRVQEVMGFIEAQKLKWQLPCDCKVAIMYEAGQDGFWLYRTLKQRGYDAMIIDPASIPVERYARRAKTDRLDAIMLVNTLLAYVRGERDRMRVIRVPEIGAEGERHLVRDRGELQKEIQQHRDRMRKLLRTVGNWGELRADVEQRLSAKEIRCFDGSALPEQLQARLVSECERQNWQ